MEGLLKHYRLRTRVYKVELNQMNVLFKYSSSGNMPATYLCNITDSIYILNSFINIGALKRAV